MLDENPSYRATIIYRPIQPSDLEVIEQIHLALLPVRYEPDFFFNVVNGCGIISSAAVNGCTDELVGFITMRIVPVKGNEIEDLVRSDSSNDDLTVVHILTLGVSEAYQNLGIATSLVREAIKYASSIRTCRAVYLHAIDYNYPAIRLYKKISFQLIRRLPNFYYITAQQFDAYLFVYYVNGGDRSPCSLLAICSIGREVVAAVPCFIRSLAAKLWKSGNKSLHQSSKCKKSNSPFNPQLMGVIGLENGSCQCV